MSLLPKIQSPIKRECSESGHTQPVSLCSRSFLCCTISIKSLFSFFALFVDLCFFGSLRRDRWLCFFSIFEEAKWCGFSINILSICSRRVSSVLDNFFKWTSIPFWCCFMNFKMPRNWFRDCSIFNCNDTILRRREISSLFVCHLNVRMRANSSRIFKENAAMTRLKQRKNKFCPRASLNRFWWRYLRTCWQKSWTDDMCHRRWYLYCL